MKQTPLEEGPKKSGILTPQSKASAISKQVLKSNPIPQQLINRDLDQTALVKSKMHPLRSSKVSQKLVLFPQSSTESQDRVGILQQQQQQQDHDRLPSTSSLDVPHLQATDRIELGEEQQDRSINDADFWRPHHATGVALPTEWNFASRTSAERMPKDERDFAQLARVAAYCTGEGYNLTRLRHFLRDHHHVSPRQYDEALYAAYHFPLMTLRPDKDNPWNIRVRSAPTAASVRRSNEHQSPVNRHQLERSPIAHQRQENDEFNMDYDEDHLDQEETPVVGSVSPPFPTHPQQTQVYDGQQTEQSDSSEQTHHLDQSAEINTPMAEQPQHDDDHQQEGLAVETESRHHEQQQTKPPHKPFDGGEVFVFDYGVVVFWNFHRAEELLMLEDLTAYSIGPFRDNPNEDLQIEEMHFQYDTSQLKPRIFNDMITMKTGNHMIKLTLSHGLSQSAVLARYEDIMDKTIEDTKYLPKEMAETGRLGKTRAEITTINGRLFNLRMNVNLVSNVLDTPEIFWSEPALQPMYNAIREYLEIPQRAKILNDRLRVISDLLSMLRDHLTNFGVEYQTLIIIYLIIVAVIVACFEIAVKILQSLKL